MSYPAETPFSFEELLTKGSNEEVVFVESAGITLPLLEGEYSLSLGEEELAKDFAYMFRLCRLVDSTGVLPIAGGWEDQDDEFVEMWLIYKEEQDRSIRKAGG